MSESDSDSSSYEEQQEIKQDYSCFLCRPENTVLEAQFLKRQEEIFQTYVLFGRNYEIYVRCVQCRDLYHAKCANINPSDILNCVSIWKCEDCRLP